MGTKVMIVDDHRLMREGLRSIIELEPDMEVVAEASGGRDAVMLAKKVSVDAVIMDITMPDLNGIEATNQVLSENPNIKVVALSMHSDDHFVAGMLAAGGRWLLFADADGATPIDQEAKLAEAISDRTRGTWSWRTSPASAST